MTIALWDTPTQEDEARRVVSSRLPQVHKKRKICLKTKKQTNNKNVGGKQTNKNTVI